MRRLSVLSLLLALTAAGCVTTSKPIASPAKGQTPAQLAADDKACEAEAQKAKDPAAWVGGLFASAANEGAYQVAYRECMVARGYTVKEN